MDYEEYLLVPKKRIGVLIGEKGKTRRNIEKLTGVRIEINSKTGEVNVQRKETDAIKFLEAKDIVTAIARGFPPEKALQLLQDDTYLRVIDLEEMTQNDQELSRQKSRLIGRKGKARKFLEKMTHTDIRVYGKSIAIIGNLENLELATRAIEKLVSGTPHGHVYRYIEKQQKKKW